MNNEEFARIEREAELEVFKEALEKLINTGRWMTDHWPEVVNETEGYPSYLPSFDEFVGDLMTWRDNVKEKTKPVSLTDAALNPESGQAWDVAQ